MPVTPFHFGPGLLLKSAAPRHVSFTAFAATQVAVDVEPLYHILRHEYPVHRVLHTVWAAGAMGLAVGLAVWAGARDRTRRLDSRAREDLERNAAIVGGLLGGITHPLLDGLMHRDMRPLWPFAQTTWVVGPDGVVALHVGCILAGALGAAVLWLRRGRP